MKYLILFLFLVSTVAVQAQEKKQSLKELLYSGKLKKDSSGVIRSTDDLSAKIDTSTQKAPEVIKKETEPAKTTIATAPAVPKNSTTVVGVSGDTAVMEVEAKVVVAAPAVTSTESAAPAKTNTRLWKEYLDSLTKTLKSEVLNSKKIKKETYFVMIEHEIGTDGMMNVLNVTTTPENSLLQAQVKQILDSSPLRLNPVLDSTNQPRKVKRKQSFTVTKD